MPKGPSSSKGPSEASVQLYQVFNTKPRKDIKPPSEGPQVKTLEQTFKKLELAKQAEQYVSITLINILQAFPLSSKVLLMVATSPSLRGPNPSIISKLYSD